METNAQAHGNSEPSVHHQTVIGTERDYSLSMQLQPAHPLLH